MRAVLFRDVIQTSSDEGDTLLVLKKFQGIKDRLEAAILKTSLKFTDKQNGFATQVRR